MRLRLYLHSAGDYVSRAEFGNLAGKASRGLYSETAGVMIRKDLGTDSAMPAKKRQPQIRPASTAEVLALVAAGAEVEIDADELWQRRLRRHIVATIGVEGCYVADAAESGPSFMQYLFTSQDNDRLQANFPGLFPILDTDEAIVEFLYVAPESRNPGVAVNCLVQVTEEAQRRGAASVISFIDPTNKGALFVNHLAGFQAQSVRRSKRRLFRSTYSYEDWPPDTSRALSDLAAEKVRIA